MNILMFSGDPNILHPESAAHMRMRFYARAFTELHIIVIAQKNIRLRYNNLFLYSSTRFGLYRAGKALCKNHVFDAITAQGADEGGIVGCFLAKKFHIPFQLQIHTDIMNPRYRRASWKERVRYWIAWFLIPRADCVRAVSWRIGDSLRESRITNHESRITILPIFSDLSKFFNPSPDSPLKKHLRHYDFKIISLGRFVDKEKNFSMLIRVMQEFIAICPKALLVLAGDGPDKADYEIQIKNRGLKNNVILREWTDDLPSLLKSCDLFVLPSNYEGWGAVVIEAAAAGLPILMTDVGLAGEIIKNRENGIVVPAGDNLALLNGLIEMYKNPQKRKEYAEHGNKTIKNLAVFQEEEFLRRYRRCFEVCVKN